MVVKQNPDAAAQQDPERSGMTPQIQSQYLQVGNLAVHARVSTGCAPSGRVPVVLVHGLGMSSRYMVPLAQALAPDFPVYVPDLPGFGLSERPKTALDVSGMADALAAFMDAVDLPSAALIGNSLGCEVLVELALRHPARVERLVLQGPTPDPRDRSAWQKALLLGVTGVFERPSLAWIAIHDYLRCGILRFVRTFRAMMANRIEPKLEEIKKPTLVVWGSRDYIVPRRSAERFARLLPQGRLVVVRGAAHGMNYSHPLRYRDAILPFLLAPLETAVVAPDPSP